MNAPPNSEVPHGLVERVNGFGHASKRGSSLTDLVHLPRKVAGVPDPRGLVPRVNQVGRWRKVTGALIFAFALSAAAIEVTFDVQPRQLNLGETAQATLTLHGVRGMGGIELPPIDGLSITPGAVVQQTINFAHSVRMDYRIFPQKPGRFTIGPYSLDLNGQQLQIPETTLEVRALEGNTSPRELIFSRLTLPDTPPYVHQVFEMTLHLYSLPTVELARDVNLLGGFPETGFVLSGFEELQMVREEVDGQFYNLRRFRARARALTAGTFTLQPTLRAGVVDRNQPQRRRDPFGGFFDDPFSRPSATPVNATTPAASLTVRPIPADGRPADFDGAVGQFEFTVDVRPRELKVGEPVTVTLRLQGMGNIAAARPPAYRDADAFRAYEARLVGDSPDPNAERGAKVFEQVLMPRTEELQELPALRFSFFDPQAGQYRTASAGPFPLTVHPSENGSNALLLQVPGAAGGVGQSLVLGSDIVYLQSAPARWNNGATSPLRANLAIALHAAAPLALAGLWFATRRRRKLATDVALSRRQQAPRSARVHLRKAEAALRDPGTPAAVFAPLASAVLDYFGHRLNLPPGAVDSALLHHKFTAAQLPDADLDQWREFFALADRILYAIPPALSRDDLARWIATVTALLRKAERVKL